MQRTLILLILQACNVFACAQSKKNSIALGSIYREFESVINTKSEVSFHKTYDSFNWIEGKPGNGIPQCKDCFDVSIDKNNEVVQLLYLNDKSPFNGRRMSFYSKDNHKFMTLEEKQGDDYSYLPVFFIICVDIREAYMINTRPQTGDNPTANALFEGDFPVASLQDISSITILDDMFMARFSLRFSNGKAFLGSKIVYDDDVPTVRNEKLFLLNIEGVSQEVSLSDSLDLSELKNIFDGVSDIYVTAIPDINPKYLNYPIWFWGGAYHYR